LKSLIEFKGDLKMTAKQLEEISYAAQRLNKSVQQIYAMVREGILPSGVVVKLGRSIRIDPDALEEFIKSGGKPLEGGWRKDANI
jgi:excisionase family DNA binding protein